MKNPTVKKALHFLVFLLLLGLICGGVLALVNSITAPVIAKNEQAKVQKELSAILGDSYKYDVQEMAEGTDSVITAMYSLFDQSNNKIGVIYKTEFQGFANKIIAITVITFENDEIKNFKVIQAAETKGNPMTHNFGIDGVKVDSAMGSLTQEAGCTETFNRVSPVVQKVIDNYTANKGFYMGE